MPSATRGSNAKQPATGATGVETIGRFAGGKCKKRERRGGKEKVQKPVPRGETLKLLLATGLIGTGIREKNLTRYKAKCIRQQEGGFQHH